MCFVRTGEVDQSDQRDIIVPVEPVAPGNSSIAVVVDSRAEHAAKQG